jgi:Raf kinase inhibitor-like YbhB/YbcL family protein
MFAWRAPGLQSARGGTPTHALSFGPCALTRLNEAGAAQDEIARGGTAMRLTSTAFGNQKAIPRRFSGEGDDVSPPLSWKDAPRATKSFALICEDPDAPRGTFRHWAAYDIAPDTTELPEAFPRRIDEHGIKQAMNDFGKPGYGGPMPPKGHGPHHYHFRLIALDSEHLPVKPGASVQEVEEAARAHSLVEARLTGLYERH